MKPILGASVSLEGVIFPLFKDSMSSKDEEADIAALHCIKDLRWPRVYETLPIKSFWKISGLCSR
jgi:hypothetical protein